MKTFLRSQFDLALGFLLASLGGQPLTCQAADPAVASAPTTNAVTSAAAATVKSPNAPPDAPASPKTPPPKAAAPVALSPEIQKIVDMAQSGVSDDVLLAYITNSPATFQLNSDQIVYLSDLGLPETIITAMINHQPPGGANQAATQTTPSFSATAPQVPVPDHPWPGEGDNNAPPPQEATTQPPPGSEQAPPPPPASAPPQVTYNYFYSYLSPYGNWVWADPYGWCWQPSAAVINPGWRPYCDEGRWLDSDCGWYWQSYYSWGWAPFHYGNWFCDPGFGWCWDPGFVWAPSWVCWRYSDLYCGWAPLPPGACFYPGAGLCYNGVSVGIGFGFGLGAASFTFVAANHFCDPYPWHHALVGAQVNNIYSSTTVVNNYAQNTRSQTIVNNGLDPRRVPALSRSEIQKVSVRDLPAGSATRPDRVSQVGNNLVVYRPQNMRGVAPATLAAHSAAAGGSTRSELLASAATRSSAPLTPSRTYIPRAENLGRPSISSATANQLAAASAARSEAGVSSSRMILSRPAGNGGLTYGPQTSRFGAAGPSNSRSQAIAGGSSASASRNEPYGRTFTPPRGQASYPSAQPQVNRGYYQSQRPAAQSFPPRNSAPQNYRSVPGRSSSRATIYPGNSRTEYNPRVAQYPGQDFRSQTAGRTPYSTGAAPNYSSRSYAAPNYPGNYSAPGYSSRAYSAPSYSAPSYSTRAYSFPSRGSYSAPSYSFPSRGSYSYTPSVRSYSAPSYRAPSYSGGGFSRGFGGYSGGSSGGVSSGGSAAGRLRW